jgi:hypothetical protein
VNENLHLATSMFAQIVALLNNILVQRARNPWLFFSHTLGLVFDIPKWKIQRIVERKKKSDQGIPPSPNHQPPKINEDQLRIVKEFVYQREVDEKNPLEPEKVCAFIQTTFDITYHRNWINQLVKKLTNFFIVNAIPLESECFDLKIDDL